MGEKINYEAKGNVLPEDSKYFLISPFGVKTCYRNPLIGNYATQA